MPVKIRLMRIGAKKRPFYRVVAVDERKKRTGAYLELLGTYNPISNPKEIKLDQVKIDEWLKKGAQPSDGFLRIIGKAKQRPERAPKKQKKETPAPTVAEEKPAEESAAEVEETSETSESPVAADAPVTSEESLNEAPQPESAEEAAEVIEEAEETEAEVTAPASDDAPETPTEDKPAENSESGESKE